MHESMPHAFTTVCILFGHETRTRTFRNVFAALQFSHKIFMQNRIQTCNFLSAMKVQNTETMRGCYCSTSHPPQSCQKEGKLNSLLKGQSLLLLLMFSTCLVCMIQNKYILYCLYRICTITPSILIIGENWSVHFSIKCHLYTVSHSIYIYRSV